MNANRWVGLPQAAKRLGVPWPEVIELVRERQLEGKLVSRARWFITEESLRRYELLHGTGQAA